MRLELLFKAHIVYLESLFLLSRKCSGCLLLLLFRKVR